MKKSHFGSMVLTVALAMGVGASACGGSGPSADETGATGESALGDGRYQWWRHERDTRQAALDSFFQANSAELKAFKNTPLGNKGIPMVMLRLFPELFPEIWGAPSDSFAPVGFAKDTYEPSRVLPLGLGFAGSTPAIPVPVSPTATVNVNVNVVALTCMGCHGGRIQGSDNVVRTVVGMPNTQFTNFRGAVYATVTSPKFTADTFRAALAAKPLGFVYGDPALGQQEALERAIFLSPGGAEKFVAGLKAGSIAGAQRFAQTLGAYTYRQVPNPPDPSASTPGFLDAIGAGISAVVDPAVLGPAATQAALPPAPAMIDIMSVWRQDERPLAQWDGSIKDLTHRNLAAEFGVIGDPAHISMENVDLTTPLTVNMPSPPYPFDVERPAAARGEHLYNQYCASCHTGGNAEIFSIARVGTDPNRSQIWKPYSVAALRSVLRSACTDPVTCNHADGTPLADEEIVNPTGGYMAVPLRGIWARAPYLHNGSVPTLAALLTGKRPAQFYRGNIAYDETNVGFANAAAPGAVLYDTTRSGLGNGGHDTREFLGDVDWKNDSCKTHDLLEYLKTL